MKSLLFTLSCAVVLSASQWELVWQDEFSGTEIDTTMWDWDTAGNEYGWGNNEDQFYTHKRSENSRIENGSLIIEAHRESWQGKEYTSARLRTKERASWLYGKFEIRAKIPDGKGTWPAFWLLPEDDFFGNWPKSGEIDVMEYVGYQPNDIHSTIHTESLNHELGTHKGGTISLEGVADSFHTYSAEWYPDSISFYVDSIHVYSYVPESKESDVWPFNKPFHVLLNLAIGGDWGGVQGIDTTIFPVQYEIDFVRVYRDVSPQLQVETISYGNGSVSISPEKEYYQIGDTVVITAVAESGYELRSWSGTSSSTETELTYVVESHASFAAEFKPEGEMLKNSDFSEGFDGWNYYVSSGNAAFTTDSAGAVLEVTAPGDNSWDIQLGQGGLSLEKGVAYTFSVQLESSDSVRLIVGVGESGGDWSQYLRKDVILNNESKDVSGSFTAQESDPDARVFFDCGDAVGTLRIKSVSLKKSESASNVTAFQKNSHSRLTFSGKTIRIQSAESPLLRYSVVDTRGRVVVPQKGINVNEEISLDSLGLASGIYFFSLYEGKRVVQSVRIAVSK